jgi:hypothetical protein
VPTAQGRNGTLGGWRRSRTRASAAGRVSSQLKVEVQDIPGMFYATQGLHRAFQPRFHEGHATTWNLVSKNELKSLVGIPYWLRPYRAPRSRRPVPQAGTARCLSSRLGGRGDRILDRGEGRQPRSIISFLRRARAQGPTPGSCFTLTRPAKCG